MFFALTFLQNTDMNICNETKSCNLTINLVLLGFQLIIFFSTPNVYYSHKPGFQKFRYLVETWISRLNGDIISMFQW